MDPYLIDSHCHLHFPAYDKDRDEVLLRMKEKTIWGITIGTSAKTSQEGIAFAEANDTIFASVGFHPEHLTSSFHNESEGEIGTFDANEIEQLAASSKKVVGIGETGLDFFRIDADRDRDEAIRMQESAFRDHLRIAKKLGKPLIIHCRDALARLAEIIQEEQSSGNRVQGVVHCYTGTWQEAQPLLDLGLHLAFGGIITFPPKKTEDPENSSLRVIERMPMEKLIIETDAPWLTPVPHRGEKNEPTYVEFVAKKVAELRGMSFEEVAAETVKNTRKLFQI